MKALYELENVLHLTQSEWNTLKLLVEFHEGSYSDGEEAPFNVRDFENLLAKLKG